MPPVVKLWDEGAQFRWIVVRLPDKDRRALRRAMRGIHWKARKWVQILTVYDVLIVG